jgi:hypothetical protein
MRSLHHSALVNHFTSTFTAALNFAGAVTVALGNCFQINKIVRRLVEVHKCQLTKRVASQGL